MSNKNRILNLGMKFHVWRLFFEIEREKKKNKRKKIGKATNRKKGGSSLQFKSNFLKGVRILCMQILVSS